MKYKAPLVAHFQQEIQEHDLLPVCKDAVKGWAFLVDSKESRYLHTLSFSSLFTYSRFPINSKYQSVFFEQLEKGDKNVAAFLQQLTEEEENEDEKDKERTNEFVSKNPDVNIEERKSEILSRSREGPSNSSGNNNTSNNNSKKPPKPFDADEWADDDVFMSMSEPETTNELNSPKLRKEDRRREKEREILKEQEKEGSQLQQQPSTEKGEEEEEQNEKPSSKDKKEKPSKSSSKREKGEERDNHEHRKDKERKREREREKEKEREREREKEKEREREKEKEKDKESEDRKDSARGRRDSISRPPKEEELKITVPPRRRSSVESNSARINSGRDRAERRGSSPRSPKQDQEAKDKVKGGGGKGPSSSIKRSPGKGPEGSDHHDKDKEREREREREKEKEEEKESAPGTETTTNFESHTTTSNTTAEELANHHHDEHGAEANHHGSGRETESQHAAKKSDNKHAHRGKEEGKKKHHEHKRHENGEEVKRQAHHHTTSPREAGSSRNAGKEEEDGHKQQQHADSQPAAAKANNTERQPVSEALSDKDYPEPRQRPEGDRREPPLSHQLKEGGGSQPRPPQLAVASAVSQDNRPKRLSVVLTSPFMQLAQQQPTPTSAPPPEKTEGIGAKEKGGSHIFAQWKAKEKEQAERKPAPIVSPVTNIATGGSNSNLVKKRASLWETMPDVKQDPAPPAKVPAYKNVQSAAANNNNTGPIPIISSSPPIFVEDTGMGPDMHHSASGVSAASDDGSGITKRTGSVNDLKSMWEVKTKSPTEALPAKPKTISRGVRQDLTFPQNGKK